MKKYDELKIKIEELQNIDFDYTKETICYEEVYVTSLLRKALIYFNQIGELEDKTQISELRKRLDLIMGSKIKDVNPDFSDSIIKEILCYYKRGVFQYPFDIFVIGNAVFSKEAEYNDFGDLYKLKTFMARNNRIYFDVCDNAYFCEYESIDFLSNDRIILTNEQRKELSKFISTSINEVLRQKYQGNVTRPLYELNTSNLFYGYDGLTQGEICGINIFLNKKFKDIAKDIANKHEFDIEMIVQANNDITLYNLHQSFNDSKPVWNVQNVNSNVWRLSEEALKIENSLSAPQKKIKM